ncbi:MAG: hypothetical protein WDK96_04030 [Candidatus Paceibacterota bacterium]|jgi:hypothetical protein
MKKRFLLITEEVVEPEEGNYLSVKISKGIYSLKSSEFAKAKEEAMEIYYERVKSSNINAILHSFWSRNPLSPEKEKAKEYWLKREVWMIVEVGEFKNLKDFSFNFKG